MKLIIMVFLLSGCALFESVKTVNDLVEVIEEKKDEREFLKARKKTKKYRPQCASTVCARTVLVEKSSWLGLSTKQVPETQTEYQCLYPGEKCSWEDE